MKTVIPAWIVRAVVTAIIGTLITGFSVWGAHLSQKSSDHEKRIAVMEDHEKGTDESLKEIKETLRTQSNDTKEILRRLPRR